MCSKANTKTKMMYHCKLAFITLALGYVVAADSCLRLPKSKLIKEWNTELCFQDKHGGSFEEFDFISEALRNVGSVVVKNTEFIKEVNHLVDSVDDLAFSNKLRDTARTIEQIRFGLHLLGNLVLDQLSKIQISQSGSFCFGLTCVKAHIKINLPNADREAPLLHFHLSVKNSWLALGLVPVTTGGHLEARFSGITDWHVDAGADLHIPIIHGDIGGSVQISTTHGIHGCLRVGVFNTQLLDVCFQFLTKRTRHRNIEI